MSHTASPAYRRMLRIAHEVATQVAGMYHPAVSEKTKGGVEFEFREGDGGFIAIIDITPSPANLRVTVYHTQQSPANPEDAEGLRDPIYQAFLFSSGHLLLNDNGLLGRALIETGVAMAAGFEAVGAHRVPTEQPTTPDTEPPSS